jgi:hypothetical protein
MSFPQFSMLLSKVRWVIVQIATSETNCLLRMCGRGLLACQKLFLLAASSSLLTNDATYFDMCYRRDTTKFKRPENRRNKAAARQKHQTICLPHRPFYFCFSLVQSTNLPKPYTLPTTRTLLCWSKCCYRVELGAATALATLHRVEAAAAGSHPYRPTERRRVAKRMRHTFELVFASSLLTAVLLYTNVQEQTTEMLDPSTLVFRSP